MTCHAPLHREPPSRDECERVRTLYEAWLIDGADPLTTCALVWQIPRLLARIARLEELLRSASAQRATQPRPMSDDDRRVV